MRLRPEGEPLDDEFRAAVSDVHPLAPPRRVSRQPAAPSPLPRQTRLDESAVLDDALHGAISVDDALESGDELVYLRDGLPRQVLRKLRGGYWVVQATLDLHGMNRAEAARATQEFLRRCSSRGVRCVRIVHGKGLRSPNREPVLKHKLHSWLPRLDEVLAFCQAPGAQGGSGALMVLLRG
ncbi:MAG: Smr/MutS family protein [Betaproteobacteria bacterium]|nr:Smr/MutS family protein [Betaproteobacteria bacterium]